MSKSITLFGLELLQKTAEDSIKCQEDRCIILLHWILLKRNLRCLGVGDEKKVSADESLSELLPNGWNDDGTYMLRYACDNKIYLTRITKTESGLLVNLIKAEDMKIASVMLTESDVQKVCNGEYHEVVNKLEKEVVDVLIPKSSLAENKDPLRVDLRERPVDPFSLPINNRDQRPLGVGRSDIDPFGFGRDGNPGMLYPDPGRRGPFGGIRFDPINPGQGPARPRGGRPWGSDPDPDHFGPPGGGFFM